MAKSNLDRVFAMPFAKIYPLYVDKAEQKGRTKQEVNKVLCWLTGYSPQGLLGQVKRETTVEAFIDGAPKLNPKAKKITGVVCGVRVEDVEHPTMQKLRYMDKLVDELAKGWPMEKILRA